MNVKEIFVPAVLTDVRTIDPGEIRAITLVLPEAVELEGRLYPIRDAMRPGNAFLAKPMGARTQKVRRRMYTRSNAASTAERVLETLINHTHEDKADTSIWWQSDAVDALQREGGTIDVRLDFSFDKTHLVVFENSADCGPANLRLEPDDLWPQMRFVAIALSTGITPFLAYLAYMETLRFGRTGSHPGTHVTLIASARSPKQLMEHEKLQTLAQQFPENFRYHPVLTREWPDDWPHGRGRILRATDSTDGGEARIDLQPLLDVVPDLTQCHLRLCGSASARSQLALGLQQGGYDVLSLRMEVW
jgi:hypothetical protein